jgi:hypothetical protein
MTWGGFKRLFLSKESDVKFTDKTNIKDFNVLILEKEVEINLKKQLIKNEIEEIKFILKNQIQGKEEDKVINDFIAFIKESGYANTVKRSNLVKENKHNKKIKLFNLIFS